MDGAEELHRLAELPLPLGLRPEPPVRSFHREIYLDTPDGSLEHRGATCRLRIQADDTRTLALILNGGAGDRQGERWETAVAEADPRQALEGDSEPARRLRGLVDPALLKPRIEIETERWTRTVRAGLVRRIPRFDFLYDACAVRHAGLVRTFEEIQVRRLSPGGVHLNDIATALDAAHGLRPLVATKAERAMALLRDMAGEASARMVASQRAVVILAFDRGEVAFVPSGDGLALPVAPGSGEEACRHLLRELLGSGVGELTLLGQAPGQDDQLIEVWAARKLRNRGDHQAGAGLVWIPLAEALGRVGTPELRSVATLGALAVAARTDLRADTGPVPVRRSATFTRPVPRWAGTERPADQFVNVELSQIAFHQRVLELAEDANAPLAERLRFLAIVTGNFDEFFAVRVGALKMAIAAGDTTPSFDGLTPAEQFAAVSARLPPLIERQTRTAAQCLALAHVQGVRVRRWADLDPVTRAGMVRHFTNELLPLLSPRAVTTAPGHPFPIIPHGTLAFAVLVRDIHTGPVHFAYLAIPARLPRFLPVPGGSDLILIEDVVRANLQAFYPDRPVEEAWLFRITRAAELDVQDEDAGDLLQAITEEVGRRPHASPVRLELEQGMPSLVRDLLMRELRFERRGTSVPLTQADVYEIDGWLDLSCLRDLAARLPASANYPAFVAVDPFAGIGSLFEAIDEGDRLVHHPFEDFSKSTTRLFEEAAADPDVYAIKMTLYRVGETSALLDALVKAAEQGKEVSLFVELKARFDEMSNAKWVKRLEEAGAQVVYGLVGLKIHAKVALVVRKTAAGVRRYAHIATGNYNAATAKFYTDLAFFTADPEITADIGDLFNQLTGSTRAPSGNTRRLLISPLGTIPGILTRIDREIEHAKAGREARIRIQMNGLEDPELIGALYRAAGAGVSIDLVIRGLCLLRPGVPGLSERIRVRSVLGRFLEHQRIFHFRNGGDDDYLIGSPDLRPRNLRRRVEVICPVARRDLQAELGAALDRLVAEPAAWDMGPDGSYHRTAPAPGQRHVHDLLIEDARARARSEGRSSGA